MELRHLEYFLAVAEELNFTRAARRLHVVQSGVSASVRALERDLDAKLFDRTSKKVVLTEAGAALLPEARRAVEAANAARDAVARSQGGLTGSVSIGTLSVHSLVDLPALFAEYHVAHPGVRLRLVVAPSGSAGLAESLLQGSLDVAFLALPGPHPGLNVKRLTSTPMVAVLPAAHPLAARDEVDLRDLAGADFIDSPAGYGNRMVVDERMETLGLRRRVVIEVPDVVTAPAFVRGGLGVAVIPAFAAPSDVQDSTLRVLDIAGPPLMWETGIATASHGRFPPAVRALLPLVENHVHAPARRDRYIG
ncbi:LysR family transcriptional regulator [Streptomyces fructofermentans]|uniref:LysR family transcriptional regulator n=1 Tax=Streptomyces fructofermentans TaxID=152141 RepID=UPI003799C5CE